MPATATTLSITPDKSVYAVGETITLLVLGDSEGALDNSIFGDIVFDPSLATAISSSQEALTSLSGSVIWTKGVSRTGPGFARAMVQLVAQPALAVDGPFMATVTLEASMEGVVDFAWESLDFFGLDSAPGASAQIVPEPSTALLLGLGLVVLARRCGLRTESHVEPGALR
jgi:hypothetical protein